MKIPSIPCIEALLVRCSDRAGRGDFEELTFDALDQGEARRSSRTTLTLGTGSSRAHVVAAKSIRLVDDVTAARLDLSAALAGQPATAHTRTAVRAARGAALIQAWGWDLKAAVLDVVHHDRLTADRCAPC